jgi:deazaflavin-dependent oxidoreductase (nitroreductase family)
VVAIAASNAGQPTNPAWFHNLRANPDTTIQIGHERRAVRARVASDSERAALWPECVAFLPGYASYERNANGRQIPVVILAASRDA